MGGEIARAKQALFLCRDKNEQYRSTKFFRMRLEVCSNVQQQGAARCVVQRAVVNAISVDGGSDTKVIDVCRKNYILVLQDGVAAWKLCDDVVR